MSIWGFVGMLAFLIAWAVVYREDIKKYPNCYQIKEKRMKFAKLPFYFSTIAYIFGVFLSIIYLKHLKRAFI